MRAYRYLVFPVVLATACSDSGSPRTAGTTAGPERLYVSNEDSQDLTVIDAATDSVVVTIPVGTRPRGVHVGPDGRVFVALSGSPKCPPSMPDAECARLTADRSRDGRDRPRGGRPRLGPLIFREPARPDIRIPREALI